MIPELDLPHAIDRATRDAAAAALRQAGHRISAPAPDVDLVLDVVFAEVQS